MGKRRFFYDTEFIETGPDSMGIRSPSIDLISIGIVDEAGERSFYGCCLDARFQDASDWVRMNVLPHLPPIPPVVLGAAGDSLSPPWYTRKALAKSVLDFLQPSQEDPVEMWAWYGAYDHVALCWLFGTMTDLPPGMPMFTMDVKQLAVSMGDPHLVKSGLVEHNALEDAKQCLNLYRQLQALKETS